MLVGKIIEFDERAGLGAVQPVEGGRVPFHCTEIADGSRHIEVGTQVRYELVPGNLGVWEAGSLEPVG